jgi:two-component sensor histidine kinase
VPSLDDVVRHHTTLGPADVDWLHLLVADWQIIADLSFADLILWLPDAGELGFWAGAQMRPTTGPTAHVDDVVGAFVPSGRRPLLDSAWSDGRIAREGDPEWRDDVPVRVEAIPVRRGERVLGVVARSTNLLGIRTPSRLELSYLQTAADLATMISEGHFPYVGERSELTDSMRVGDGFVRTDVRGLVTYASPNALSAFRRLGLTGDLLGQPLARVTRELAPSSDQPVDPAVFAVVSGHAAHAAELENAHASLVLRSMPLLSGGVWSGSLLLLRDVTELRRRERELVTKEATIREIHHRVKNNLQTVAALLRLQARRVDASHEVRVALEEATRRVAAIAVVHETLSQSFDESVDFDDVADRLRAMVVEVATSTGTDAGKQSAWPTATGVTSQRQGSFGRLAADLATSLSMVLVELLQNAVEHGFPGGVGCVRVVVEREAQTMEVRVEDDGVGLPADFDPAGAGSLGIAIVRTLVESELGGRISFASRQAAPVESPGAGSRPGAVVTVVVPLGPRRA